MATTRTAIEFEALFESRSLLRIRDRRRDCVRYPKPGPSRQFFISLVMCLPVTCMLWAAIIYGAVKLAQ